MASTDKKKSDLQTVALEGRKVLGNAIIEGLIAPTGLLFERLATEGGDYTQGDGGYTQSGGGDHTQSSGDYNQSASVVRDDVLKSPLVQLDVAQLSRILQVTRKLG